MMLTRDRIAPPVSGPGLVLFFLQHFFFIAVIIYQIVEVTAYKTATPGSFSVAEAAYVTGLWTQVVASGCAWIAWTIFCGTFIVANRITRLHEAYLSSFALAARESVGPAAPRPGQHSLAAATREANYAGRSYTVHGDGMVVSDHDGSPATWRTEAEFQAWADKQLKLS